MGADLQRVQARGGLMDARIHMRPGSFFSNSLLTDLHIWDATVAQFIRAFPSFRFLRYNTRGYESASDEAVNFDLPAGDVAALLDALGVHKCLAVIGVSLGGITYMNFATRYPARLDKYIACDCNVASSKTWISRVTLAQSVGGWAQLANQTVERWFHRTRTTSDVQHMICLHPGKDSSTVWLRCCDFNLAEKMKEAPVPGLYVFGHCDGIMPKAMANFAKAIPQASFVEIAGLGHLPMVEQSGALFWSSALCLNAPAIAIFGDQAI